MSEEGGQVPQATGGNMPKAYNSWQEWTQTAGNEEVIRSGSLGAVGGVQTRQAPKSFWETVSRGVQDTVDFGLVSDSEATQLQEIIKLPSGLSIPRYQIENRLRRLETAAPKRGTEYWMGLADIAMVGMPTFGEKKYLYEGRAELAARLAAMDNEGIGAFNAQGLINSAVMQRFGVEKGRERLAWAGLDEDMRSEEELTATGGGATDFGPGSLAQLGIETITDRAQTDALVAAFGRKLMGTPNPGDGSDPFDREFMTERELAKTQVGDKVYKAVSNIGTFFVPVLGHVRALDQTVTLGANIQEEGLFPALGNEIREQFGAMNLFEPGIDVEERIARGLMVTMAAVGLKFGASAAKAHFENVRGLKEYGYSTATATKISLAQFPVMRKVFEGTIYADPSLKWVAKEGEAQTTMAWRRWLTKTPEQAKKTADTIRQKIEELTPAERTELKTEAERIVEAVAAEVPDAPKSAKIEVPRGSEVGTASDDAAARLAAAGVDVNIDTDLVELQKRQERGEKPAATEEYIATPTNKREFQIALEDKFRLRPDEARAAALVADAYATTWAAETGRQPGDWYVEKLAGIGRAAERFKPGKEPAKKPRFGAGPRRDGPKVRFEYHDPVEGVVTELDGQVVWNVSGRPIVETPDGWRYHVEPEHILDGMNPEMLERLVDVRDKNLAQGARAMVEFLDDGRALIRALERPDVSSILHELAHIYRRDIYRDGRVEDIDMLKIEKWAGVKNREWTVEAEEKFAQAFEKYLQTGKAPTNALKEAFSKFKKWLTRLYRGMEGSPIEGKLHPDARQLFDRLLGKDLESAELKREADEMAAMAAAERAEQVEIDELLMLDDDDPRLDPYSDEADEVLIARVRDKLGGGPEDPRPTATLLEEAREMFIRAQNEAEKFADGNELIAIYKELDSMVGGGLPRVQKGPHAYAPWYQKSDGTWYKDGRNLIAAYARDDFLPHTLDMMTAWMETFYNDPGYVLVPSLSRETIIGQTVRPRDGIHPSEMMLRDADSGKQEIPGPIVRDFYHHIKATVEGTKHLYQSEVPRDLPEGWEVRRRDADQAGKQTYEIFAPGGEARGRADTMEDAVSMAVNHSRKDAKQEERASMAATQGEDPKAKKRAGMAPEEFEKIVEDLSVVMVSKADVFEGDKGAIRRWLKTNKKLSHLQSTEVIRRMEEIDAAGAVAETYRDSGGSYRAIKSMLAAEYPHIAKARYNRTVRRALEMAGESVAVRPRFKTDKETGRKEFEEKPSVIVIGAQDVMVPAHMVETMQDWAATMAKRAGNFINEARWVEMVSGRNEEIYNWLVENRAEAVTLLTENVADYQARMKDVYGSLLKDKGAREYVFYTAEGFRTNKDGERLPFFLDELKRDRPGDWQQIVDIAEWHRTEYEKMFAEANEVRKRFNIPQIPYRKDYFTHIREQATEWEKMLGRDPDAKPLAGKAFGRNSPFNRFSQQRQGNIAKADSLEAFEAYIDITLREIHLTEAAVRRRTLSKVLLDNDIDKKWGHVTRYLSNAANQLTGQKQDFDTSFEQVFGGPIAARADAALAWATSRIGRNKIVGNLRSALMQTAAVPVALPVMGGTNLMTGAMSRVSSFLGVIPDPSIQSPFLRRRYLVQRELSQGKLEDLADMASIPLRVIEETTARTIWTGFQAQALKHGHSIEDAIVYADKMTEKTIGGRAIGEMSPVFKTVWGRTGMQFQYEVGNFANFIGKDLDYDYLRGRKRTAGEKRTVAMKMMVSLWIANEAYEQVFGSRPLPDAIDMTSDMVGIALDDTKTAAEKFVGVPGRVAGEFAAALPGGTTVAGLLPERGFFGGLSRRDVLGSGEVTTFAGTTPITGMVGKVLSGNGEIDWAWNVTTELGVPFGGSQLKKTVEGTAAAVTGSVRKADGDVRYKVDSVPEKVGAVLFGPGSTQSARDFYDGLNKELGLDSERSSRRTRTRRRTR